MRRVWLIRAGDDAEVIDSMRDAGLIGLRYETVGNALEMAAADIEKAIMRDPAASGIVQKRTILQQWFAIDAKVGDLVVSPNPRRGEVWVGILTGDYRFEDEPQIAHYAHTRSVDWLGWLDRDAAWMRSQLKSIDRPLSMYELYSRDWWWNHVGTSALSAAPRASWSKTPATRTRAATSSTSGSTPRAAAKPKPVPKPKVAPPVLCAGTCGLVWSPYVLVDGLCADCRSDL